MDFSREQLLKSFTGTLGILAATILKITEDLFADGSRKIAELRQFIVKAVCPRKKQKPGAIWLIL